MNISQPYLTFSNFTNEFNYTFGGNENLTIVYKIPKRANVTFAKLNISGEWECTACNNCSYNPGTGPNCTCPYPGSGGSCSGGCSQCAYYPSCSGGCSCASPYSGGGVKSCNACIYSPSCPSCSCPSPGSGGGVKTYQNVYSCTRTFSLGVSSSITPPSGSDISNWACSVQCQASLPTISGYTSCRIGYGVQVRRGSSQTNVIFYTTSSGAYYCTDCSASGICWASGCVISSQSHSCGQTLSCSQGQTIYCEDPSQNEITACDALSCGGNCYSIGGATRSCTGSWSYQRTLYQSSSCPSGGCYSGDTQTGCTASCWSCYDCSYTPSPPSCSCTGGYYGGGCKDCWSCTYTPSGSDCTCPSPGSGGSCPGGCSICNYTPPTSNLCTCQSPYSGGGCSAYRQVENPWIDSTDNDKKEWSFSGKFNQSAGSILVDLNITEINDFLQTCIEDEDGNCNLMIKIHSDTEGKIILKNINISYTYNTSYIFNITSIEDKAVLVEGEDIKVDEIFSRSFQLNSTYILPTNLSIGGYYVNISSFTFSPDFCKVGEDFGILNLTIPACLYDFNVSIGEYYPNHTVLVYTQPIIWLKPPPECPENYILFTDGYCRRTELSNITYLYHYYFYVNVTKSNVRNYNITFYIPKIHFEGIGQRTYIICSVDNVALEPENCEVEDYNLRVRVNTSFSSSSLEEGVHIFYIEYDSTTPPTPPPSGGGGGGFVIKGEKNFEVYPSFFNLLVYEGLEETHTIAVKNPTPIEYDVYIKILCKENDESCYWAEIDRNVLRMKRGSVSYPYVEYVNLKLKLPSTLQKNNYQFDIQFSSPDTIKIVTVKMTVSPLVKYLRQVYDILFGWSFVLAGAITQQKDLQFNIAISLQFLVVIFVIGLIYLVR
ncbi:MAG: hypothetical protein QXG39_00180 [Candidatus Aenigmatarchaeota archaeon]